MAMNLRRGLSQTPARPAAGGAARRSRVPSVILSVAFFPPWLLLEAWRTSSFRLRHWLLTAFVTIYGATITIAFDPMGVGTDGVRHLLAVHVHYVGLSFGDFLAQLWNILLLRPSGGGSSDVYKHVISYLTGGVLGAPWLFFPIVAFVYGYFFTGSMLIIFRDWGKTRLPWVIIFIAAMFFLVKNIEGVNTVRTWTGLWVLVYGFLRYQETRQIRYLVLLAMPPFIHFGYFLMALPAYAVLVFGNRALLYAALFVASSVTTFINPGQVTEIIAETELGEQKLRGYYREAPTDRGQLFQSSVRSGDRIWRAAQKFGLQKWALNVLVFTILLVGIYPKVMNTTQRTLFSVGLLTITLSNLTWFLFAVSNRTWIIGTVFVMAAFLMARLDPETRGGFPLTRVEYKWGLHIAAVLFVPYFLYNLSLLFDFPSVFLIAMPWMAWVSPELNASLKDVLRIVFIQILGVL